MPLSVSENLSPSQIEEFHFLQTEGKKLAAEGKLLESLHKFELAKKICATPKVLQRIEKLKACLQDAAVKARPSSAVPGDVNSVSNVTLVNKSSEHNVQVSKKLDSSGTFKVPKPLIDTNQVLHDNNSEEFPAVMPLCAVKNLSPTQNEEFHFLQAQGKKLAAEGKLLESLHKFELANKICETPKVLQRIEKLKAHLQGAASKVKPSSTVSQDVNNVASVGLKDKSLGRDNGPDSKRLISSGTFKTPKSHTDVKLVLHDVKNIESSSERTKVNEISESGLNTPDLTKFKQLRKMAMDLSFSGKFEESLKMFNQALALYNCPKVKKYIADIELMLSSRSEGLKEFQTLAESGEQLALQGKPKESFKKLKDAFAICPSPRILKKIQELEKKTNSYLEEKNYGSPVLQSGKIGDDLKISSMEDLHEIHASSMKETARNTDTLPLETQVGLNSSINKDSTTKKITDPSLLNSEEVLEFKSLYQKARKYAAEGQLKDALKCLTEAKKICATEKVLKRIKELEEHMKNSESDSDDNDEKMIEIVDGFKVYHSIYQKLYPYQREGVAWMWKLYNKRKGGVLGDDMGLGKTFQVIAFLSGMIDAELIKHILIIMPVGLLTNWENEFKKWCPGIKVHCFHGGTKKEKERNLLKVQRRGHVLLTSYGTVVSNVSSLTELDGTRFVWDFVILDEGHKIKNPTKTTKAVHELPARNRLVLTGTPIQNNLKELWALYDFAHQSTLLGSLKTFKMQYENIITRSREKDATVGEKRMGTEMAENLKQLIKPYFLRRTKAEVWGAPKSNPVNELNAQLENLSLDARKNDLIIWLYMSEPQIEIYQSFVQSDAVKSILVSKRSPLVELTTLKKICDHPRLLSQRACHQLGLNGELTDEDLIDDDEATNSSSIANVSDETLMLESGKLKFLIKLLEKLREDGHRILVFSLSRKILDMIHRILTNRKWKVMRIDGTISKMEERERRIQIFQRDSSYPVFLLTTQVGGVGITLTAADRVIIYDPSWNPATDAQAVDRIYRIGQKKDVVVYRLITCGSVEEKIYRRQIFKDSITRQATCNAADPYRYFSKQELRELFSLENPRYSATQVQLEKMHSAERVTSVSLDAHIAFLYSLNIFGISDHDLMFSKNLTDHDEDNDAGAISHDYIKKQVATAQNLIQAEGSIVEQGLKLSGCYSKPFSETIRSFKRPTVKDFYKAPAISEVIDIANDCEKDDIKSSRSFIGTGGDFEDIQTFSPDQKENSDKNFYKGPTLLEVPGNMNDYQKHDIRSSRSFIAMERNLDKDIQTFSPDQKQKRNWSNVNNKAPAIPEVIDIANDYEKDDIRSSRSFIGTGGRFDENIQTFSDQKNLPYQTENRDRSNANSFNKAPTIPEVIDIANDYQKDNLKSSRSFNLLDDEVYATPKALGHSLSKKDKITNYYTPSGKKHENPNTKSARKFLYSPDRSRLESYQSPYVRKNHAIDATSSPNATHNANSLQHKMEESSSSASKNSMCEPEIKNKAADSTICKELNANIFQTPTSKEKKISLKSPCNKVICSVEHDFELNSNCTSVHTDNVNIVNDQDINNGEGKYEDHIDKTSSPIQNKLITPRKIDFHSDLSQILNTNFDDLDFDDQPPPARGGSRRKSCARRTIILSDSEASQGSSSANTSSNKLAEYTDTEADSVEGDSFNRAASSEMNFSRSVIPDSVPNSPSRGNELDLEDIQTLSHSTKDPESKPSCDRDYISNKSEYRVKRITPLRVDQCSFKPDYSFSKALAASPLIEFESQNNSVVQSSVDNRHSSGETIRNESLEDSPVHVFKKKTRNVISSDSEDSDSDRSELESVFESINSYSSDSEDSCSNKADESQNMFSSDEL